MQQKATDRNKSSTMLVRKPSREKVNVMAEPFKDYADSFQTQLMSKIEAYAKIG